MIFRLDLKIFIFLILFYFTKQIKIYALVMLFAIIHETSHLIVGLFLKLKVKKITLMPLGLSVEFYVKQSDNEKNKNEMIKIMVALAGPLTNILIIIITKLLAINDENIVYSNMLIAIFNLLPIYPLDGGRILKSILVINKVNAEIYVNRISNIFLFFITFLFSILIYYMKNIALLLILGYLWYVVLKENKIYRIKQRVYDTLQSNELSKTITKNIK